jgi:hypothetical protein
MSAIVRHISPAGTDALDRLVGCRVAAKIVRGGLGNEGLWADEVLLLGWPAVGHPLPSKISCAIALVGTIEKRIWVSMEAEERPASDLVKLGVTTTSDGRVGWADGFRWDPSSKSRVVSVEIFEETFTLEADETGPAQTIESDSRVNINFDHGDPFCFEIGAVGQGFFRLHRDRSLWTGADPKSTVRHSHGALNQPVS